MDERWLPVVGYEGLYEVSNTGRVRSLERRGVYAGRWKPCEMFFPAREMKISTSPAGYKYLALRRPNEEATKHLVHRLVMRAFVGEPPIEKPQVNHKDGIKANNDLDNLEYTSCLENLLHCTRVLGKKRGERAGNAKLTEAQVRAIKADTRILREVAADYGVTLQAVAYIRNGRNWSHVQPKVEGVPA